MLSGIMWSNLMQDIFLQCLYAECLVAVCHYDECFYAEWLYAVSISIILSVIFSGVLPLSVSMPSFVMLNVMEPMFDPSVTATMKNHRHTTKQGLLKGEISLYH
jgi:hypothetical protein